MKNHAPAIFVSAVIAGVAVLGADVRVQDPPRLGNAPISHIAVAVRDIDASTRSFADVFDVPVPAINNAQALAAPEGLKATTARAATVALPNFLIEIQQPVSDWGPIYEVVQKFGPTVHHIGIEAKGNYGGMRDLLVQKGGRWLGGTRETSWAYVDFREPLGATLEPVTPDTFARQIQRMSKTPPGGTLGSRPVLHVGLVVRNAEATARAYADILGVPLAPVRIAASLGYPEGSTANRKASMKVANWTHENNIDIELIEPVGGPTPWSEALQRQGGNGVHHLAFDVGDQLDQMIRLLQAKGGKWTFGAPGGRAAYLDFTDKLGLVIELMGTRR